MRKSIELDHLLENAVAMALGVDKPHPFAPKKLRLARTRPARRHHHVIASPRREHARVAA